MSLFDSMKGGTNAGNASVAQSWRVSFANIPMTLDELKALPEAAMREPHHAAALLIPALCIWPVNKAAAVEMINFLKGPSPLSPYDMQFIGDRLRGKEYLPSSFFEGSSPQNGYEPTSPYTVTISTVPTSFSDPGYATLYIRSSGADSPRPVKLRQKPSTGEWFLWEQMLLSDIRIPAAANPWA